MNVLPEAPIDFKVENSDALRSLVEVQLKHVRELLARPLETIAQSAETVRARHPLVEALEGTERWIESPILLTTRIEGYVVEATGLGTLIDARVHDPGLPDLIAGMVDPNQYLHNVGVLGVAFAMDTIAGPRRPELIRQSRQGGGRIADVRVPLQGGAIVDVEAKAPKALRLPPADISPKIARTVAENALNDAAHPLTGQLPRDRPGLVAIAAHGLPDKVQASVNDAAQQAIDRFGQASPNLIGLLTLNFYRRLEVLQTKDMPVEDGKRRLRRTVRLTWGNARMLAKNRGYTGVVSFNLEEGHEPARENYDFTERDTVP